MALFNELFRVGRLPGWLARGRGRQYADICLLAYDAIIEGLYQGRLNLLGVDPHPSAVPHIAADIGIPNGLYETIRHYMVRMRRRNWSWRAAGLAGVANVHVDALEWVRVGGAIPTAVSGTPTEAGNLLRVSTDGVIGTAGITYYVSTDNGVTFGTLQALGTATTIAVGDVTLTFAVGATIVSFDLPLRHGGRGLRLNDFGAPIRGNVAASSPAGDESMLHELANQVGACRIRLVTPTVVEGEVNVAYGTWWTREVDGYTWRLSGGPWGWEAVKDVDPSYWARGLIIIDNPPNIDRWETFGSNTHYLDEAYATFGTSATMEWWNHLYVTAYQFKPAHIHVLSIILNFDSTKFVPNDASTCMQDNWYLPHQYDADGNVTLTRPLEYAYFSREF